MFRNGLVLQDPNIVLVLVWVKSDLLLLASSWVHVVVGVEVSALSIVVAERDTTSKRNIHWHVLHCLGVQSSLEFR